MQYIHCRFLCDRGVGFKCARFEDKLCKAPAIASLTPPPPLFESLLPARPFPTRPPPPATAELKPLAGAAAASSPPSWIKEVVVGKVEEEEEGRGRWIS